MSIEPEFRKRDIRSFVIRRGRMTAAQQKGLDAEWLRYGLSLHDGLIDPQVVFGNSHPVVIEIGFGMGDSLLAMAEQYPDYNFIGIEVHLPGVGRLVNEAGRKDLSNLRVYCADAIDVLSQCIAENSIFRIQLFFPDPWHKKRHHKRRIVQPSFVELVVSRLQFGGVFHACTDWSPYAVHMLEVLQQNPQLVNQSGEGAYVVRPKYRPVTKFERRGEQLGHDVRDLLFSKRP